ncbi:MAG: 2-oxo acid dehydrogenase subunit E2, partial [Microlunatus sp.]|nr:2-oxo acid dehydrogenase subunit E2 [Microlunatus sp.]
MNLRTFNLPDLGEGLTEAEIIRWLVSPGDVIIDDEPVVEVETAKATVEVPAPYAGAVTELHGEQGGFVQVGSPLITVEVGAVRADEQASPALEEPAAQAYVEEERAGSGNVLVGYGTGAGSGSAARAGRRRSRSSRTAEHRPA